MDKYGHLLFANKVLDRCDSTNDIAKGLAEKGFPNGTWVSARIQDKGRGRLGRRWESIEGNLFFSLISRIQKKSLWNWIPLVSAVSVVQTLRAEFPGLEFKIKWPNDIWIFNAKLGGILCESGGSFSNSFVVIGVGLNCLTSPEIPGRSVTNLTAVCGGERVWPDQIRLKIIDALTNNLTLFENAGPGIMIDLYQQWALFKRETKVSWGKGKQYEGIVQDLGSSGELNVKAPTGEMISLYAEDVFTDF